MLSHLVVWLLLLCNQTIYFRTEVYCNYLEIIDDSKQNYLYSGEYKFGVYRLTPTRS